MGHFTKRDPEGMRPGADRAKRDKEVKHHRVPTTSRGDPTRRSFAEGSKGNKQGALDSLVALIEGTTDTNQLEALYKQYAGRVAPHQLSYIARYSDLQSREGVRGIYDSYRSNQNPLNGFLPLHHLATVFFKEVPGSQRGDSYVCLLGVSPNEQEGVIAETNLRMLEFFLGTFAGKLRPGKYLSAKIDGKRISIPFDGKWSSMGSNERESYIQDIRGCLRRAEVGMSNSYTLRSITDGDHKIAGTKINVVTVPRTVYPGRPLQDSVPGPISSEFTPVLISYAAMRPS